jgi:hypothetical protein
MTQRRFVLSVLSAVLSLGLAVGASAAPPIQATAQAARTTVQVGEPVRITIQVRDSEEVPRIDAPAVEGVKISSTATVEATPSVLRNVRRFSNGHAPGSKLLASLRDLSKQLNDASAGMPNGSNPQLTQQYQAQLKQRLDMLNRNDYAIVYLATPEKTGSVTVPPFTVHSGGQTVKTQPLQLSVTEARPSPWVKAALSLSDAEPSVGDTVDLYVDLLVRRWIQQVGRDNANLKSQPINHVTLTVPSLEGYKEIQPLEPLEKLVEKRRLPPGQLGYHINYFPGVILLEQEPASGAVNALDPEWYRRRLTIPFRAVQAGVMEVPPLRVGGEVYVPTGGKERYTWEGFVASSAPLKFRILEGVNQPADTAPSVPTQSVGTRGFTPKTPAVEEPSAPAEERSPAPRESEEEASPWLLMAATLAAAVAAFLVMARVAVVLRGRLAVRRQRLALMSRQRQAVEEALQRLRTPPWTAADVSAAMQDFLRAHLEMELGEITPEEAAERLTQAGYPVELAEKCALVLRACAAQQFAPPGTVGAKSDKDLALAAECLISEILAKKPEDLSDPPARVDELTRQRQAALAD